MANLSDPTRRCACHLSSRGHKHGFKLSQEHHHKAKDAPRGTRKNNRTYTSICPRWRNDAASRKSQQDIGWSDAFARCLDHIAQVDLSHTASHEQRGRYHNLIYLRGVDEDRQAPPLSERPGYNEAKAALVEMQKQSRQDVNIVHSPTKDKGAIERQTRSCNARVPGMAEHK